MQARSCVRMLWPVTGESVWQFTAHRTHGHMACMLDIMNIHWTQVLTPNQKWEVAEPLLALGAYLYIHDTEVVPSTMLSMLWPCR